MPVRHIVAIGWCELCDWYAFAPRVRRLARRMGMQFSASREPAMHVGVPNAHWSCVHEPGFT